MSVRIAKQIVLGLAIAITATSLGASIALAQSKIRSVEERRQGKGFWENSRASRNIQHARDYSRAIQRYTTQVPMIDPAVTKAESEMLGHHVQGIQREMTAVRESNVSNPQVVEHVKSIETKMAQVASTHKKLHEECCKSSPDGKLCAEMASKISSSLDQIAKDHEKLLTTMGQQEAAVDHAHGKPAGQEPAKSAK